MERSLEKEMIETIKFNLWVFWHDIRFHKITVINKNLDYPEAIKQVNCKKCKQSKVIIYEDGLESYY